MNGKKKGDCAILVCMNTKAKQHCSKNVCSKALQDFFAAFRLPFEAAGSARRRSGFPLRLREALEGVQVS
ncbi:hypothetical protein L6R29_14220 [Myxococcota bacterium]|nr:hypothetical protein [Myxococcota bacterium]